LQLKELSQEEFADFAEGDDSFYNDLNLESFDASTTLVDALGLGPSSPHHQPLRHHRNAQYNQRKAHCNRDGRERQGTDERNYVGSAGRLTSTGSQLWHRTTACIH
jgi:hypothetical protein